MELLHVIDPVNNYPHDFGFEQVHYFHNPGWSAKRGEYLWLIWTDGEYSQQRYGYFMKDGVEVEDSYIEVQQKVKGMIELQQSPYNEDVVWLKFFEVTTDFRGQKFSKVMMEQLAVTLKERFPSKIVERSMPSEMGKERLHKNLSECFDRHGIKYTSAQASFTFNLTEEK